MNLVNAWDLCYVLRICIADPISGIGIYCQEGVPEACDLWNSERGILLLFFCLGAEVKREQGA